MIGAYPIGAAPNGDSGQQITLPIPDIPIDPSDPGTGPDPIVIPIGAPRIYTATIMRESVINLSSSLGPAVINLTVSLP